MCIRQDREERDGERWKEHKIQISGMTTLLLSQIPDNRKYYKNIININNLILSLQQFNKLGSALTLPYLLNKLNMQLTFWTKNSCGPEGFTAEIYKTERNITNRKLVLS